MLCTIRLCWVGNLSNLQGNGQLCMAPVIVFGKQASGGRDNALFCCVCMKCSRLGDFWARSVLLLAGGKAAASEKAAGGKPQKMSRKERLKLKKAQKRQERAAGSDDDDLGTGGPGFMVRFKLNH